MRSLKNARKKTPSPERARQLVLAPQLLEELDGLARTAYGCVIVVCSSAELGGAWGVNAGWGEAVYKDSAIIDRPGSCTHVPGIRIANAIDIGKFSGARRPEMDWGAIPRSKIYHFVVLHEIGHRLNNFSRAAFLGSCGSGPDAKRLWRTLCNVNEALADRFAWSELFPGRPVPKRALPRSRFDELERDIEELRDMCPLPRVEVRPLPPAPAYVPRRHVDAGIPWAVGPARHGRRGKVGLDLPTPLSRRERRPRTRPFGAVERVLRDA